MEKRLLRSQTNKVVAGVCGGIGEYFDLDPVLIRIIAVLLFFATGIGLLAYIVAWIIMPQRDFEDVPAAEQRTYSSWNKYMPGMILIAIGTLLLIRESWFWFDWEYLWPIILVVVGLMLIFRGKSAAVDTNPAGTVMTNGKQPEVENGGSL
ncbi:MAG: PspC domain-containing protein [Candidatus Zixiibacteriota bacterium]